MSDNLHERPKAPKYQSPLKLTHEQIEFIAPLLKMERREGKGQPSMVLAQVRSASYPNHGDVEIAFALVSYRAAAKILDIIASDKDTRYPPTGRMANYVEILPQGEVVYIGKDKRPEKKKLPVNIFGA